MVEELLKKIPAERCWDITGKTLTNMVVLRGDKMMPSLLSIGEGIIAPVLGLEKYLEINTKIWGDSGKITFPLFKDMFGIPVEDAVGAIKLATVVAQLLQGPEFESEIVEATPERAVWRIHKCAWWERYKENEVKPEFVPCVNAHQAWGEEGVKAISPKLTYTLLKAMPRGDPYCEAVIEFKEE